MKINNSAVRSFDLESLRQTGRDCMQPLALSPVVLLLLLLLQYPVPKYKNLLAPRCFCCCYCRRLLPVPSRQVVRWVGLILHATTFGLLFWPVRLGMLAEKRLSFRLSSLSNPRVVHQDQKEKKRWQP